MLLVVADNAAARAASRGNTVPLVRTGYHIGSHYELYQAEGVNPTMFSYIVGDVTIELARMVDLAQPNQILLGDFDCEQPGDPAPAKGLAAVISTPTFVRRCDRKLGLFQGVQLSNQSITSVACLLTRSDTDNEDPMPRRFRITDKHVLSRYAYNLEITIELSGESMALGLGSMLLPGRHQKTQSASDPEQRSADAEAMFDDLAAMLRQRSRKTIEEG